MPLNLELKARVMSPDRLRDLVRAAGGAASGVMTQVDTYFAVRSGRLKLREIGGTQAELISYERPEEEETRWSRYEKTPVAEPLRLREMLEASLGILVTVRKTRELFLAEGTRIHLDQVEGVGCFVEIEVPAVDPAAARARMDRLRALLEIGEGDVYRRSYSDMVLSGLHDAGMPRPAPGR
jgi:predicted adenylyl cyclase CyaB